MTVPPPDRVLALLDAVLSDDHGQLDDIARGAHLSAFHLARQVSGATGEPPVSLRRRVRLERAAWQLQRGARVTDVALDAGFESVDGFSRAFARAYGCAPSQLPPTVERGHWLPSPNGIHFHGPSVLYVDAGETREHPGGDVLQLLVRHDLDDVRGLLAAAGRLDEEALDVVRMPGHRVLDWHGPEETLRAVLTHLAGDTEPWLAMLDGAPARPRPGRPTVAELLERHDDVAPRWLAWVLDVDRRSAWADSVVDALCEPPESFRLGQVVSHVLTFSAQRRHVARWMLSSAGVDVLPEPDPVLWHRRAGHDDPSGATR
ncbi:MAG: helix-turn-helix transcriptional regulator [Propionibacteriales bacterium]|nr:helix-turn-helix transcriptional regulator [Propionibacteriales bacterium]